MSLLPLMCLEGVSYSYGSSVKALENVGLELHRGEIHALIGEHGAGKSSLAHILSGFLQPEGRILWKGLPLSGGLSVKSARELGISYVTQRTELFEHQSVAINLFNNHPGIFRGIFYRQSKLNKMAELYLNGIDCPIDPRTLVKDLSKTERVLIDILRHVYRNPSLLILDEAIEKLTAVDLTRVMRILRELRDRGCAIVFITHRIDDVYEFADRVTILRQGNIIITETVGNIDKINLIKLAYTQLSRNKDLLNVDKEFYHLLKYNEAILEFLPISLLVVNRENRVKLVNNYGKTFFSRNQEAMLNRSLPEIFGYENEPVLEQIGEILKHRRWDNLYQSHLKMNGQEISTNIVVYPIMDGNYYLGSIIIIDDMTEQEELRKKIQLSEKLASVGLLAAGVAHEINNPLEIITNYLDILKGQQCSEEAISYIGYLEEELDSITTIIGNLITFSENNRYEEEDLDLAELLTQMLKLVRFSAVKREITIASEIPSDDIPVRANKTKLRQVFLNIIRNAFDSMSGGGELYVRIHPPEKERVTIEFCDSGTGLSEEEQEKVMLPFYTTKEDSQENMGLGLSIVYGILKSYKGSIDIRNREDRRGVRVRITLPLLSPAPPPDKPGV